MRMAPLRIAVVASKLKTIHWRDDITLPILILLRLEDISNQLVVSSTEQRTDVIETRRKLTPLTPCYAV